MLCARCEDKFELPKLRFKRDGIVQGTRTKKWRGLCNDCDKIEEAEKKGEPYAGKTN